MSLTIHKKHKNKNVTTLQGFYNTESIFTTTRYNEGDTTCTIADMSRVMYMHDKLSLAVRHLKNKGV